MAIAFDAAAEKETATAPASPQTWTHTPSGTPKGVVVKITQLAGTPSSPTDFITSVTYGGVALTRVRRATDSTNGKGAADIWFLGSGVPTGAQTVSVALGATTTKYHFVSTTVTGSANIELVDSDAISDNTADPSVTLQYGGRTCLAFGVLYCGKTDPLSFAVNANCTVIHSYAPVGTGTSSIVFRQTTPGTADFAIGGVMTTDDSAYSAACFSEVVAPPASASDVASATFSVGTETTGGTLVIPVTVQTGDDLFVLVTSRDHTSIAAAPTVTDNDVGGNSFVLLNSSSDRKANRYWKKATSGTAGKTVTVAGAVGSCSAGLTAFRDTYASGDPTTNLSTAQAKSGTSGSVTGFTPDYSGSEICLGLFNYTISNATVASMACTSPGTLEPEHFLCPSTGGNDCQVIFASAPQSGGLAGTGNFTWSQNSSTCHAMTWAIRPAVEAVPQVSQTSVQNPVHGYAAAGTYTVRLTVTDNDGNLSIQSTRNVTVS